MNKSEVIQAIINKLESQLEIATEASLESARMATDEESRAESKWDTQGLESSYLAAGQAEQAKGIAEAIQQLKSFLLDMKEACTFITPGALIKCTINGSKDWYFLSPEGGGVTIDMDGTEVTVITPQSPIASSVLGREAGATFSLPNGSSGTVLSVS